MHGLSGTRWRLVDKLDSGADRGDSRTALVGARAAAFGGIEVEPPGAAPIGIALITLGVVMTLAIPTLIIARLLEDRDHGVLPFAVPAIVAASLTTLTPGQIRIAGPHPKSVRVTLYVDGAGRTREMRVDRGARGVALPHYGTLGSHDEAVFDGFAETREGRLHLHVFDLLYLDGVLLTARPYAERRALLAQALADVRWNRPELVCIVGLATDGAAALAAVDARDSTNARWETQPA